MAKNISITLGYDDGAGTWQPLVGKKVYLKPSRTDIFVKRGSVWMPWEGNPDNDVGYKDAVQVVTNELGVATFQGVPYTDSEVQQPLDASGAEIPPGVVWNIIDPNAQGGVKVYFGALPSSLGNAAVTVYDLVTLAPPDNWSIAGAAWQLYPQGREQEQLISVGAGIEEVTVTFVPQFTAAPRLHVGSCTDSTGALFSAGVKENGSGARLIDGISATLKLSGKPSSTIYLPVLARG